MNLTISIEEAYFYMIPTYIMQLEKLPLNINGKIDEKSVANIDIKADKVIDREVTYNEYLGIE